MQVQMIHTLAALFPVIDDNTVTLGQLLLSGDLGGDPHAVTDELLVIGFHVLEHGDTKLWNDQDVSRRLRSHVSER